MAPTLTPTARVRLRPPKPPPRLVEPPRTTSNGHRKQVPDVVAAAKLTLATLRAGDARAARRRCLRAGFHALRVGVANERLERAATAVRRREAAAEHRMPSWVREAPPLSAKSWSTASADWRLAITSREPGRRAGPFHAPNPGFAVCCSSPERFLRVGAADAHFYIIEQIRLVQILSRGVYFFQQRAEGLRLSHPAELLLH